MGYDDPVGAYNDLFEEQYGADDMDELWDRFAAAIIDCRREMAMEIKHLSFELVEAIFLGIV